MNGEPRHRKYLDQTADHALLYDTVHIEICKIPFGSMEIYEFGRAYLLGLIFRLVFCVKSHLPTRLTLWTSSEIPFNMDYGWMVDDHSLPNHNVAKACKWRLYDHKRKLLTIPAYLVPVIIYSLRKLRIINCPPSNSRSRHFIKIPYPNENNGNCFDLYIYIWWPEICRLTCHFLTLFMAWDSKLETVEW